MKIRILGCHGSDSVLTTADGDQTCNTCGILVNDSLLIDAGTVASALSLDEQRRIRHIILSHLHFDHIRGLPTLADNLSHHIRIPVTVAGIPEVMDGLRRHIFNSDVYPNFFTIPSALCPTLVSEDLKPGNRYSFGDLQITPILVNHTVPTSGLLLENASSSILYSGDTTSTEEIWHAARRLPYLKAAFIECSYPNAMEHLARTSKHLTPNLMAREIQKLERPDISLYAYHLKPVYKAIIVQELHALQIKNLTILEEGQTLTL